MIPYGDNLGGSRKPWVTPALIWVMSLIFLAELTGLLDEKLTVARFALYPIMLSQHPVASAYRLVTSEFLHGGIMHLVGNMCFLYAFGRTIEKLLGSWLFLIAFPLMGLPGGLFDALVNSDSEIPRLGASGCISTIMGMYLSLAYWARIKTYFGQLPGFTMKFEVPSWVILIYFIILQLLSVGSADHDGVAYDVHIVCFLFGLAAGQVLKRWSRVQDNLDDIQAHPLYLGVF